MDFPDNNPTSQEFAPFLVHVLLLRRPFPVTLNEMCKMIFKQADGRLFSLNTRTLEE